MNSADITNFLFEKKASSVSGGGFFNYYFIDHIPDF